MTDKERIIAIMTDQHLNNAAFCAKVGINAATLSNILRGSTNPTLQVLRSIKDAFPQINPTWIFMGEGEMLLPKDEDDDYSDYSSPSSPTDLFSASPSSTPEFAFGQAAPGSNPSGSIMHTNTSSRSAYESAAPAPSVNVSEIVTGVVAQLQKPTRKIIEVRIFFDDGTFETFSSK